MRPGFCWKPELHFLLGWWEVEPGKKPRKGSVCVPHCRVCRCGVQLRPGGCAQGWQRLGAEHQHPPGAAGHVGAAAALGQPPGGILLGRGLAPSQVCRGQLGGVWGELWGSFRAWITLSLACLHGMFWVLSQTQLLEHESSKARDGFREFCIEPPV